MLVDEMDPWLDNFFFGIFFKKYVKHLLSSFSETIFCGTNHMN